MAAAIITRFEVLTQAQYDALARRAPTTLYIIVG
jgi:hypothetical protein